MKNVGLRSKAERNWDREWRLYNENPFSRLNPKIVDIVCSCLPKGIQNKKIIELGAGKGSDIILLTKKGANGYALDFSHEAIRAIEYWMKKENVKITYKKADARDIPFPDSFFDLTYSVGLMEHFHTMIPVLLEQIRITKDEGFVILDVPQKYTLYTIAKHVRMKFGKHPFGWETEYSKKDLETIATKCKQTVYKIYGRDLDIIQKAHKSIQPFLSNFFSRTIENTWVAPYICLNIGLILKIKK